MARGDRRQPGAERVAAALPDPKPTVSPDDRRARAVDSPFLEERDRAFSRSAKRVTLQEKPDVKDREYRTADLNLWTGPREKGKPLEVLDEGGRWRVTGVRKAGFAQILYDGQVRWVKAAYLSTKKPVSPPRPPRRPPTRPVPRHETSTTASTTSTGGVSTAPCPDGSGTESGLTSSAVTLFRGSATRSRR